MLVEVHGCSSRCTDVGRGARMFVEVHGCRIENERRNVLFTVLVDKQAVINTELDMFGLFAQLATSPVTVRLQQQGLIKFFAILWGPVQ